MEIAGLEAGKSALTNSINSALENVDKMRANLESNMSTFSGNEEDLLTLQYQMGQYNTIIEVTSSIVKSLSDNLKSIASKL